MRGRLVLTLAALALVVAPPVTLAKQSAATRSTVTISGHGSRVVTIRLARNSPLVVTGFHNGQSNFIVRVVGSGTNAYVFNEIGVYRGQAAVPDIKAGRFRVAVQADGSWTLGFAQPMPPRKARLIPGTISGQGARVVAVRSTRHMQPIVTATHRGESNFIVQMIGYGNTSGQAYVFNEIGNFHGQTLMDDLPRGTYLLYVQGDGPWTLRFSP